MAETEARPLPGPAFDFSQVGRYGPSLRDRVNGSARLAARQRFGRRLSGVLAHIQVSGEHHVPAGGPVILAVNHLSFMDGPLLFGFMGRVVSCLVKTEAFLPAGGRAGRVLISAAQIPVRRGTVDAAPVRLALDILDAGGVVGVFPEGTRGDGSVRTARPGVGYLALKTGAAVVPVAIHGSSAMTHRRRLRRPTVSLIIGPPVLPATRVTEPRRVSRSEWLATTEVIRADLAALVERTRPALPAPPAHPHEGFSSAATSRRTFLNTARQRVRS